MIAEQGNVNGWVGNLEVLNHLAKHGALAEAERLMAEDEAGIESESISAGEFLELLEKYR